LRLWLRFGWRLIIVWPTLVLSDFRSLYLFFSLLVLVKGTQVLVINNGLSLQTKMTSIFFSIWSCYNKPIICRVVHDR
jgi:hypothetical protein